MPGACHTPDLLLCDFLAGAKGEKATKKCSFPPKQEGELAAGACFHDAKSAASCIRTLHTVPNPYPSHRLETQAAFFHRKHYTISFGRQCACGVCWPCRQPTCWGNA